MEEKTEEVLKTTIRKGVQLRISKKHDEKLKYYNVNLAEFIKSLFEQNIDRIYPDIPENKKEV